jgi:hypothetical protein
MTTTRRTLADPAQDSLARWHCLRAPSAMSTNPLTVRIDLDPRQVTVQVA